MGDLLQRFEISAPESPSRERGGEGVLARAVRAVVGGAVLVATVVAGAVMGSVLLLVAGVLAVGGLATGAYLRWKLRRMIRDQARQMGGANPVDAEGFAEGMRSEETFGYSGNLGGGKFQIYVRQGGFGAGNPTEGFVRSAEEPLDVEVIEKDET